MDFKIINTKSLENKNSNKKTNNKIDRDILNYFSTNSKERANLNIEVEYIDTGNLLCDFKIGIDTMYPIKNIREFSYSRFNNKSIIYGMDFIYNPSSIYFNDEDTKILEIIQDYGITLEETSTLKELKSLHINEGIIKRLFKSIQYREFKFKYKNLYYYPNIIEGHLPIDINLNLENDEMVLKCKDKLPTPISKRGDIVFYEGDIYILSEENGLYYRKLFDVLNKFEEIRFKKIDASDVLSNLIPKLECICNQIKIDNRIKNNISDELVIKYFFDLENSNITCKLIFDYIGISEDKFIIRNTFMEEEATYSLYANNFNKIGDMFIFYGNDSMLYEFLVVEINRLKNIGEVYYSDKLKEKKIYNSTNIKIGLGEEINHYLDFNFKIENVEVSEYKNIVDALKSKKKFYKLGNGNFINLEEEPTKEIFRLIESLGLAPDDKNMKIHSNKLIYINNLLTEKKLPYIEGMNSNTEILKRFKNRSSISFETPNDLNTTLRDYQIEGLRWLETLDACGLGGILADEMGLGKTVQIISFLLNKKGSTSIIVIPTSLIHNWKNEFEKFAEKLKIGICHGSKKDREKVIENISNFDIILTSYASLRNDIDKYSNIYFDYCIIDEAQNIKNPISMNTDAVKAINAKTRFALTGTPIENNLQELWSIFDFIMPGYLYNLNKFSAIFIRYNEHKNNLKKMIKPFILRRTKKQVIKELPEKIEKHYFVELNKEQKKIYGVYVNDIQNKIKDKKNIKDKITIFSYLTKLRQLCLDPKIVSDQYIGKSAKTDACISIIKEYSEKGNKILVFSQFTSVLKIISEKLENNNIPYSYLDGQTKAADRIKLVDEFNGDKDKKVFLISLKAGGTGLNLTSANTVIHFDPWWNPFVEDQASDRAHRYGQKDTVEVIKIITKGTIEEKIIKLQQNKKRLVEDIIEGGLSNSNLINSFTDEELLELFR